MNDREIELEMAAMNKDLAEFWIDEVDLLEIHKNASRWADNNVVAAVNKTHRQLERCATILHGEKLRWIFGYIEEYTDEC